MSKSKKEAAHIHAKQNFIFRMTLTLTYICFSMQEFDRKSVTIYISIIFFDFDMA